jgi:hypothetical protein
LANFGPNLDFLVTVCPLPWRGKTEYHYLVNQKMEVSTSTAQPCLIFHLHLLAEYVITMPNMYARGILFGKMVLELGDTCIAKNEKHNIFCDLEFKTKGFFSGTYNAIVGRVRRSHTDIGEISGRWSHLMELRDARVRTLASSNSPGC